MGHNGTCMGLADVKCTDPATVRLIAPDGKPAPGCRMCKPHAEAVIEEYRVKAGWTWSAQPIDVQCPECGGVGHAAANCEMMG